MKKIQISEEARQAYLAILESEVTESSYSAYSIHKVVNRIMLANGLEKIRPQMMYNYARNGLIVPGEKIFGATLREFTPVEVMEFVIRYCTRNEIEIKFTVPVNPDQLELDLQV